MSDSSSSFRRRFFHPRRLCRAMGTRLMGAVLVTCVLILLGVWPSADGKSLPGWGIHPARAATAKRLVIESYSLHAGEASKIDSENDDIKKKEKKDKKVGRVKGVRPTPPFSIPDKIPGKPYVYFIAIGDQGTGKEGQQSIAQLISDKAGRDSLHFVLLLGDNFYEKGISSVDDPQWQSKFEVMYDLPFLNVPFFATLGNHDHFLRNSPKAQVEYSKRNTRWRMPERYYTFSRIIDPSNAIQFFALDTEEINERRWWNRRGGKQLQWLESELKKSSATWRVVFGHHPVFSNGHHGSDKGMQRHVRPLLEKYQVDFYICGHDHDRHLLQPVGGVHYVVSGTGAKFRNTRWKKNTIFAATNLGFVWYRVSTDELHVQFIDGSGKIEFAHTVNKTNQEAARRTAEKKE